MLADVMRRAVSDDDLLTDKVFISRNMNRNDSYNIIDYDTKEKLYGDSNTPPNGSAGPIVGWSCDGRQILMQSAGGGTASDRAMHRALYVNAANQIVEGTFPSEVRQPSSNFFTWHPTIPGRMMYMNTDNSPRNQVWDVDIAAGTASLVTGIGAITANFINAAWLPDGRIIATRATGVQDIRIINGTTGALQQTIDWSPSSSVSGRCAVSADGRYVTSAQTHGGSNVPFSIYDFNTSSFVNSETLFNLGIPSAAYTNTNFGCRGVAFSPDGSRMAVLWSNHVTHPGTQWLRVFLLPSMSRETGWPDTLQMEGTSGCPTFSMDSSLLFIPRSGYVRYYVYQVATKTTQSGWLMGLDLTGGTIDSGSRETRGVFQQGHTGSMYTT